ncbi:selenocysteine-specific translation elongation factor [Ktedonosporobacter rubrisoli]|uniref:Selenocysteine-specific elongation factor n=1 Tax=Ktedonosporobacter rubrisoli TaxID=2509675 RepID=A0A4P6JX29_KTERU|nr:selenocysteine-specific translation elongation factor [Ktedonosporobacter rubrisoli]QBD79920.1 selenocysteine-specific translation elongation factor [Ktedonosporobacter rubrisoli]
MSCIGTAGHVDHGKSTLVKALTGIDPDRLAEEKERGMTIDLGFAWLKLPGGREVSIVDVPGHESFIKNMLAGVGGIDAALLVVAADEGVMPQTREHLAILDLLGVRRGVVALTKIDLVDEEWLELVREEVSEQLEPTLLKDAPILPVSAYSGQGLPELLQRLDSILDEAQERQNVARPRLPIDRVFTMTGFGTVVTGTLLDGVFKVGQEVEILPRGIKTRLRTLQTHKQQLEVAQPGSRVAMNLANVARTELARGDIVALPGQLHTSMLVDARIQLLADAARPLTHNMQVDFYCGTQEIPTRVRLLDVEELQPGKSAWAQLRFSRPAAIVRRERFILRVPSPSVTIGGGEVIDVRPRYHRRFQQPVLLELERLLHGSPEELVLAALDRGAGVRAPSAKALPAGSKASKRLSGYDFADIVKQCNLAEDVTQFTLETLLTERRVCKVGGSWFAQHIWDALVEEAVRLVSEHHRQYPLRSGLSKEEWRARLNLSPKMAAEVFTVLQTQGRLEAVPEVGSGHAEASSRTGGLIRLPNFIPRFTARQEQQVEQLVRRFQQSSYTPPGKVEAETMTSPEVVTALVEQGRFVKLGDGILFLRETYDDAIARLMTYLREHGKMTVAEARDVLGTTRKYILPLLEHLDALHITRRMGDERVPGPAALRSGASAKES